MIKVLLYDRDLISSQLFERLINESETFRMAGPYKCAADLCEALQQQSPDILIFDICYGSSPIDLQLASVIRSDYPDLKIILVTKIPEPTLLNRSRKLGFDAFWYKQLQPMPLLDLLSSVSEGHNIWPKNPPATSLGSSSSTEFTQRELQVLKKLVSGYTDNEIAELLFISYHTVRAHMNSMLAKTGFTSRTELALHAVMSGVALPEKEII